MSTLISDDPFYTVRGNPNNPRKIASTHAEYRTARKQVPVDETKAGPASMEPFHKPWRKRGEGQLAYRDNVGNELLDNPIRSPHRRRRRAVPSQAEFAQGTQAYACLGSQPGHVRFQREENRPGLSTDMVNPRPRSHTRKYPQTARVSASREREQYYKDTAAIYPRKDNLHLPDHPTAGTGSIYTEAYFGLNGNNRSTIRQQPNIHRNESQLITKNGMMMPAHNVIDHTAPKLGIFDHNNEDDDGNCQHHTTPNYQSSFALGDNDMRTKYPPPEKKTGIRIIHNNQLDHKTNINHDMTIRDTYEGVRYQGRGDNNVTFRDASRRF